MSSLHWQARCHLCLQRAVFSLLRSPLSLGKLPKNYRAHNCSFSKWSIKRQYKPFPSIRLRTGVRTGKHLLSTLLPSTNSILRNTKQVLLLPSKMKSEPCIYWSSERKINALTSCASPRTGTLVVVLPHILLIFGSIHFKAWLALYGSVHFYQIHVSYEVVHLVHFWKHSRFSLNVCLQVISVGESNITTKVNHCKNCKSWSTKVSWKVKLNVCPVCPVCPVCLVCLVCPGCPVCSDDHDKKRVNCLFYVVFVIFLWCEKTKVFIFCTLFIWAPHLSLVDLAATSERLHLRHCSYSERQVLTL